MASPVRRIGRYELFAPIASGGMATVHLGRLVGTAGFSRTVAVKRLHDHYTRDRSFIEALLEEARLTARISHPHVAQTLDVVSVDEDVFLVMEYVHGLSLSMLMKLCAERTGGLPPPIACSIVSQALHGLHAAHEAMSAAREPLGIVHQDVSPQNIMVGADGSARVIDFGIAKATRNAPSADDQVRGKIRYMAPEQMQGAAVDRRTDVFAAGIVLYELLTGQRYYADVSEAAILSNPVVRLPKTPSAASGVVSAVLDLIVTRALATSPRDRFATAEEMALAIEETEGIAPAARVGEWLRELAADVLNERAQLVAEVEAAATGEFPALPKRERESSESMRGAVMRPRENPSNSRLTASLVGAPPDGSASSSAPSSPENTATSTGTVPTPPLFPDQTASLVSADILPAKAPPKAPVAKGEDTGAVEPATVKKKTYERIEEPTVTAVTTTPSSNRAAAPTLEREDEHRPLAETLGVADPEPLEPVSEPAFAVPTAPSLQPVARAPASAALRSRWFAAAGGFIVVFLIARLLLHSSGRAPAVNPAAPLDRAEIPEKTAAAAAAAAEIPPAAPSIVMQLERPSPMAPIFANPGATNAPPGPRRPKGGKHVAAPPSARTSSPVPAPAPATTEDPFKTWR